MSTVSRKKFLLHNLADIRAKYRDSASGQNTFSGYPLSERSRSTFHDSGSTWKTELRDESFRSRNSSQPTNKSIPPLTQLSNNGPSYGEISRSQPVLPTSYRSNETFPASTASMQFTQPTISLRLRSESLRRSRMGGTQSSEGSAGGRRHRPREHQSQRRTHPHQRGPSAGTTGNPSSPGNGGPRRCRERPWNDSQTRGRHTDIPVAQQLDRLLVPGVTVMDRQVDRQVDQMGQAVKDESCSCREKCTIHANQEAEKMQLLTLARRLQMEVNSLRQLVSTLHRNMQASSSRRQQSLPPRQPARSPSVTEKPVGTSPLPLSMQLPAAFWQEQPFPGGIGNPALYQHPSPPHSPAKITPALPPHSPASLAPASPPHSPANLAPPSPSHSPVRPAEGCWDEISTEWSSSGDENVPPEVLLESPERLRPPAVPQLNLGGKVGPGSWLTGRPIFADI